ncbi:hypothetical protein ACJJTC_017387 [Scirpophaga incertulas]
MVSEVIRPTAPPATFALDLHSPDMPLAWKNFSMGMKIYMTANNLDGEPDARKVAILQNQQYTLQDTIVQSPERLEAAAQSHDQFSRKTNSPYAEDVVKSTMYVVQQLVSLVETVLKRIILLRSASLKELII